MAIDPPTLKSVPGWPELVSVMVAGALGVNRIVLPFAAFTRSDGAGTILITPLFVPCRLKTAGRAVPVQVAEAGQEMTPAMLIDTVVVPDVAGMTIPKSRSCFDTKVSALTTLALAWMVICAASAEASGITPRRAKMASLKMVRGTI